MHTLHVLCGYPRVGRLDHAECSIHLAAAPQTVLMRVMGLGWQGSWSLTFDDLRHDWWRTMARDITHPTLHVRGYNDRLRLLDLVRRAIESS